MSNNIDKLKITFLLPNNGIGGGVRAIMKFGNELLSRGHRVRVFYRYNTKEGVKENIKRIIRRIKYGQLHDWLWDFNGQTKEYIKMDPKDFDADEVIISMCAQTTFDAWGLPEDIGVKVLHCHGAEFENWEMMLESWRLPIPKIVVSSRLGEMIEREVGEEVLGVVTDGVDTGEYYPSLPEEQRHGVGGGFRWGYSKDPNTTLKVFANLKNRFPHIPLYCFGTGKKPKQLSTVNYTHCPTITQARNIYSKCRVWFLASLVEGFGLPVLEAMACGCVVVSTACGGVVDVIKNGHNGFIVDVGNYEAVVHKIKKVYEDHGLWQEMSANALKTAKKFSWRSSAEKLEKYLNDIYQNHYFVKG